MLSTFEFWFKLNTRSKVKTLLGIANKIFFQYKAYTSKKCFFSSLAEWGKNKISLFYPMLSKSSADREGVKIL